jgi:hypothetical protein
MRLFRITGLPTLAITLSFVAGGAQAQNSMDQARLDEIQAKLNMTKLAIKQLPAPLQRRLSGGALNMLQFADHWQDLRPTEGQGVDRPALTFQLGSSEPNVSIAKGTSNTAAVSDPFPDFLFSVMAGFTQSETSTAWCGSNVVVGFNDSGSLYESLLVGPGGLSFSGASISNDGGQSFRDIGFINPGPNPANFLAGDPVVHCTDANTFYYSQIASGGTSLAPTSDVFVSKSSDGGASWGNPVSAVAKDATVHVIDKDWSAIDPKNAKRQYVTYTDFDASGSVCGFSSGLPIERIGIEIVHSSDGGASWSQPTVVDQICSTAPVFPFIQGSQVIVDSHGNVYVAWKYFPEGGLEPVRELRIAKSTNHSTSFQATSKISDVIPTGDGFGLQGGFREGFGGNLEVDTSETALNGRLYMIWDDGRIFSRPDFESPTGLYQYASVLVSHSDDGGKTWSKPVRVNDDPAELPSRRGVDHYQPGIAIDRTGELAACWYDRRDDPANYLVGRYCATSNDHGVTWANRRVDARNWRPIHAVDVIINPYYLGDYDTVVSDHLKQQSGFIGAYGNVTSKNVLVPNQDVFATLLP